MCCGAAACAAGPRGAASVDIIFPEDCPSVLTTSTTPAHQPGGRGPRLYRALCRVHSSFLFVPNLPSVRGRRRRSVRSPSHGVRRVAGCQQTKPNGINTSSSATEEFLVPIPSLATRSLSRVSG